MANKKMKIIIDGPILPGCVSIFKNKCGKANCACMASPAKLHGPYYRWTGTIDGKSTSRVITKELAEECRKRISNYEKLKKEINRMLDDGIKNAPWNNKDR